MEALVARLSHQTNPHERLQVVRADALWLKHDVHSRRGNKGPFKYKGIPELRRLVDAFFARVNASLAGPTSTNDLRMARQALRHELVTNRTSTICGLSVAKPVNGRPPNPMERHVVCDFLAPRGLGPAETAMIGLAKGPRGHRHRSILSNETDAFAAAEAVDLESCPRIAVASLLLDRQAQRLLVLETNRKDVVNVTRLRALDGSNHEAFLKFWRQSRVKLIEGARYTGGWMTSYGAVAATLGHINAMRWQVYHRLPYLLRLEDDILMSHAADKRVQHAHRYRKLMCYLTRYLKAARGDPNGVRVVHFHWGGPIGVGADVYLTSLEGAALELRRICSSGIYNGFDYMTNWAYSTMHVAARTSHAFFARTNPPSGKGSYVTQLSHFNLTALMKESARWPLAECLQWAGVDADGGLAPRSEQHEPGEASEELRKAMPMELPFPLPDGWLF